MTYVIYVDLWRVVVF